MLYNSSIEAARNALTKTGIDDEKCHTHQLTQTSDFFDPSMFFADQIKVKVDKSEFIDETPDSSPNFATSHPETPPVKNAPPGIRTPDPLIKSQLLHSLKPLLHNTLTSIDENDLARCLALMLQKDPDLARIARVWPKLPETVKAAITAMVKAAGAEAEKRS